jgi:hypothetical protein
VLATGSGSEPTKKSRATWARGASAIAALAGAGALMLAPIGFGATAGLTPGQQVTASAKTPKPVKRALTGRHAVVVAFVLPGIAEDDRVAKAIATLQHDKKLAKTTRFMLYRVTSKSHLGDLPTMFDVTETPTVAVIGPDHRLSNIWRGLVDEDLIAQSIADARAAAKPAPRAAVHRTKKAAVARIGTSNPAGLKLAKAVNHAYGRVPGAVISARGTSSDLGKFTGTVRLRLSGGVVTLAEMHLNGSRGSIVTVMNRSGAFVRNAKAKCWVGPTGGQLAEGVGKPFFDFSTTWFAKPRVHGKFVEVRAFQRDEKGKVSSSVYRIDRSTKRVVSETSSDPAAAGTATYSVLKSTPKITVPLPVCAK